MAPTSSRGSGSLIRISLFGFLAAICLVGVFLGLIGRQYVEATATYDTRTIRIGKAHEAVVMCRIDRNQATPLYAVLVPGGAYPGVEFRYQRGDAELLMDDHIGIIPEGVYFNKSPVLPQDCRVWIIRSNPRRVEPCAQINESKVMELTHPSKIASLALDPYIQDKVVPILDAEWKEFMRVEFGM
jgi:hypothetical protein